MIYVYEMAYFLVNLGLSYYHSRLILHNRPIVHWLWALVYVAFVAFGYLISKSWLLVATSVLIRELVFAQALNVFRKKSWFYINPKTGSVIDGLQGRLYRVVWFASLAVFLFTQYEIIKSKTKKNV